MRNIQEALIRNICEHIALILQGLFTIADSISNFIAMYRVLYNSIELRHAPFILWIKDLSAHDPYFVLPALVGITFSFRQNWIRQISDPTQGHDEIHARDVFCSVNICLSGLNLYIFISTLGICSAILGLTIKVNKEITP